MGSVRQPASSCHSFLETLLRPRPYCFIGRSSPSPASPWKTSLSRSQDAGSCRAAGMGRLRRFGEWAAATRAPWCAPCCVSVRVSLLTGIIVLQRPLQVVGSRGPRASVRSAGECMKMSNIKPRLVLEAASAALILRSHYSLSVHGHPATLSDAGFCLALLKLPDGLFSSSGVVCARRSIHPRDAMWRQTLGTIRLPS